jgi:hypothetical protein
VSKDRGKTQPKAKAKRKKKKSSSSAKLSHEALNPPATTFVVNEDESDNIISICMHPSQLEDQIWTSAHQSGVPSTAAISAPHVQVSSDPQHSDAYYNTLLSDMRDRYEEAIRLLNLRLYIATAALENERENMKQIIEERVHQRLLQQVEVEHPS